MQRPILNSRRDSRGAVLIVSLVFVTILMALCLNFGSRVRDNNQAMEYEVAAARALELAQAANMKNLQQLWSDFVARAQVTPNPRERVVWFGITRSDANGNRRRDGNEPPPMAEDAKYNLSWTLFGQGEAQQSCKIYGSVPEANSYVDLELVASARVSSDIMWRAVPDADKTNWAHKTVRLLVRFNFTQPSRVFDFAYFANNYGWQYDNGSGAIRIFGAMGANGDLGFGGRPWVDGLLYAALNPAINAQGKMNGLNSVYHQDLPQYRNFVNTLPAEQKAMMPPTNPAFTEDANANGKLDAAEDANGNGKLDSTEFVPGYDGNLTQFSKQAPLDMPYLGNLERYKEMALAERGAILQLKKGGDPAKESDWVKIVDGVYGDTPGEDGMLSTLNSTTGEVQRSQVPANKKLASEPTQRERNGNLALIGTPEQPLKVVGPVVITNDLVIKGKISGQGTIYTGRNLHIVGDLTYVAPPAWKQNDANFANTLSTNNTKDMVGFASKGSVILGQYYHMKRSDKPAANGMYDNGDGWETARNYFNTGFQDAKLQSYQTDPTDQAIGYYDPATKSFKGDYTASDGGLRYDASDFSRTVERKYYESSFSDDYIKEIASSKPGKVHGIFYTNHLFGGRPQNMQLYGSMVSRDEGIVFNGYCYFYYDPRASSHAVGSRVRIFLPETSGYNVWLWQELPNR